MPHTQSLVINLEKARDQLLAENEEAAILKFDLFSIELVQHPELASLYKRLSSKEELSEEERKRFYKDIIASTACFSSAYKAEYSNYPPSADAISYISTLSEETTRNHNFAFVISKVAEAIKDNKTREEIFYSLNSSYDHLYNDTEGILYQTKKDVNRSGEIVIVKNGLTYNIPNFEVTDNDTGLAFSKKKKKFIEINEANNLGLSGEQIDYILYSTDQIGIPASGVALIMKDLGGAGKIPVQEERVTCVEINDDSVNYSFIQQFQINTQDEYNALIRIGEIAKTTKIDITALKGTSLRPGLGSATLFPTIEITKIELEEAKNIMGEKFKVTPSNLSLPESVLSNDTENPLREYCRISIITRSDLDTIDKQANFLMDEVNPLFLKETFCALRDVKKLSYNHQSELAVKACLKENVVDLEKATGLLISSNPDLDPKRARRYMISRANDLGIKSNIGLGERISNLFSNISDRFRGFKNSEQKLFGSKIIPEVKIIVRNPTISSPGIIPEKPLNTPKIQVRIDTQDREERIEAEELHSTKPIEEVRDENTRQDKTNVTTQTREELKKKLRQKIRASESSRKTNYAKKYSKKKNNNSRGP